MKLIKNRHELIKGDLHKIVIESVEEAFDYVDPYTAIINNVKPTDRGISVKGINIDISGKIHVVGFGKASKRMAMAINDILGDKIEGGIVITPNEVGKIGPIILVKGDHPIPGENTVKASNQLIEYLERVENNDTLLVLISGGGSALFEIPEDGVSLDDIRFITKELMKRGADIYELNVVRKRLSKVKGGKMLRYISAKNIVSLIISDVVDDKIDTIASGPTAPDETSFLDAYMILKRYGIWDEVPNRIKTIIEKGIKGETPDTLKVSDPIFSKVMNVIVASNEILLKALAEKLSKRGFKPMILTSMLEGEAREVGKVLASIIKSIDRYSKPVAKPVALLAGGETVVTVRGKGIGGRNQELCLSLSISLKTIENYLALCMGSDGIDGISPAAGAIVDGNVFKEAIQMGLNPIEFLENNDSFTFFSKLGRAIFTDYTGTNVNDIFVAIIV
ncbi:MAG: glycerate kinase [Ignisphaera sp.]